MSHLELLINFEFDVNQHKAIVSLVEGFDLSSTPRLEGLVENRHTLLSKSDAWILINWIENDKGRNISGEENLHLDEALFLLLDGSGMLSETEKNERLSMIEEDYLELFAKVQVE